MMRRTSLGGGGNRRGGDVGRSSGLGGGDGSGGDGGGSSGLGGEIFMRYHPSSLSGPPLDPQSHSLCGGRRQQLSSYLLDLLLERKITTPLSYDLPHTQRLLNEEISRLTTLLEYDNTQNRFEQPSPLASGGIFQSARANINQSRFEQPSHLASGGIFQNAGANINQSRFEQPSPLASGGIVQNSGANINQSRFEQPSPLASGGIVQNAGANINQSRFEQPSPLASGEIVQNAGANKKSWASLFPSERSVSSTTAPNGLNPQASSSSPAPNWLNSQGSSSLAAPNLLNSQGSSSGHIVKQSTKVYFPPEEYPSRKQMGPLRDFLKQLERSTNTSMKLKGRSSMQDFIEEEMMRGIPGYEHLQEEPLHILIEAELPIEIVEAHLLQAREILYRLLFTSM